MGCGMRGGHARECVLSRKCSEEWTKKGNGQRVFAAIFAKTKLISHQRYLIWGTTTTS